MLLAHAPAPVVAPPPPEDETDGDEEKGEDDRCRHPAIGRAGEEAACPAPAPAPAPAASAHPRVAARGNHALHGDSDGGREVRAVYRTHGGAAGGVGPSAGGDRGDLRRVGLIDTNCGHDGSRPDALHVEALERHTREPREASEKVELCGGIKVGYAGEAERKGVLGARGLAALALGLGRPLEPARARLERVGRDCAAQLDGELLDDGLEGGGVLVAGPGNAEGRIVPHRREEGARDALTKVLQHGLPRVLLGRRVVLPWDGGIALQPAADHIVNRRVPLATMPNAARGRAGIVQIEPLVAAGVWWEVRRAHSIVAIDLKVVKRRPERRQWRRRWRCGGYDRRAAARTARESNDGCSDALEEMSAS